MGGRTQGLAGAGLGLLAAISPSLAAAPSPAGPQPAPAGEPPACPREQRIRPAAPPAASSPAPDAPGPGVHGAQAAATPATAALDYRQAIRTTPWGPAQLRHWCVWIEPARGEGPQAWLERRWLTAVEQALASWGALLPITRVDEPERAHLQLLRRRPPLREAGGRRRASHGRAELTVLEVQRQNRWRLEPRVRVLVSPDQRQEGIQATALHELGHGLGLWGHSPDPGDAMAAVPGPRPVLQLSDRDRATVQWLQRQPSLFGQPR